MAQFNAGDRVFNPQVGLDGTVVEQGGGTHPELVRVQVSETLVQYWRADDLELTKPAEPTAKVRVED